MFKRVLSALIGIALAVFLVYLPDRTWFAGAICIISIIAVLELYEGSRRINANPIIILGAIAVGLFVISSLTYERKTISSIFPAALTLFLILCFCVEFFRKNRAPLLNVGTTVFGAIYVGWLISHIVVLRAAPGDVYVCGYRADAGSWLVMMTFVGTWACDTAAYFIGRFFGKHKLAPKLSPNKTIEGSIAGLFGSIIATVIMAITIHLPIGHALALGTLFGVLCQLGDLSASAVKRELHIKDFGNLVPGHGGMLDRFDSLLFTAPAAFYYVSLFLKHWPAK